MNGDDWTEDHLHDEEALADEGARLEAALPPARRRRGVTIRDVAYRAGVSLQTVSRVINDAPNVRPAMRARVLDAIAALGYVPSLAAQRMNGSRSYIIMAVNDHGRTLADWRARAGNDWVDQMLLGGMTACAAEGYRLMLELVDPAIRTVERDLSAALAAVQPDGVILTPPHSDSVAVLRLLERHGIPFVRLGAGRDDLAPGGAGPQGMIVAMDDRGAAAMATRHLIDHKHAMIGFIAGPDIYSISGLRIAGWRDEMIRGGYGPLMDARPLLARGDFTFASGEACANDMLKDRHRPTAIIASNDQMALGVLSVARAKGFLVPEELSVISFDDGPSVRFANPPLTAIDQPIADITAVAVRQLIAAQRQDSWPDGPTILPARLVERASVAERPI